MYIVVENNATNALRSKYLLMPLDTIEFSGGETVRLLAVIDREHVPLDEVAQMGVSRTLHEEFVADYRNQEWEKCKEIYPKLCGRFRGEVDSYYDIVMSRIEELENTTVPDDWTGNIHVNEPYPYK